MEKQINKAKLALENRQAIKRHKFLTTGQTEAVLNQILIDKTKLQLGIKGYYTNLSLKNEEIISRYHDLWKIEKAFRISKSDLLIRPVFHFKKATIEAHILICYIAFALSRSVQQKVYVLDERLSVEKIREVLSRVEASVLEDKETGQLYRMPSKLDREAATIYRAVGVQRSQQVAKV